MAALLSCLRLAIATAVACALGFVVFAESRSANTPNGRPAAALADRAAAIADQGASRSYHRNPSAAPLNPATADTPPATPTPAPTRPSRPRPVAGLSQAQMDNANVIVKVGRTMRAPRKALVIAVATAMQESNLYNLASEVVPESKNYPHQGSGWDHDSVGLFQQRPSSGWGEIKDLMRPAYAAQRFYAALLDVPGWQQLSLAAAAQAVQISAFPDAYARHQTRATAVVAALI
jgi:hypothetical protein